MKIVKKKSAQGEYAKKGEEIVSGDIVTIKSSGDVVTGQYGEQHVFKILTRNGEKLVNFNQTTLNILHDEFDDESENWINKDVVIRTKKDVIAGKKVEIYYFVTSNWDFDEWGELQPDVGALTKEGVARLQAHNADEKLNEANALAQMEEAQAKDAVQSIPF